MGSCYSCKSGQRGNTYTTVDMANTNSDNKFVDSSKNRVCPYTRGSTTSFGFNKKRVPTTLKSLSQDRTGEMVTNYESKIANMNANNVTGASRNSPRHNKYSHIPRFGFKANSTNSLGSSEELDSSNSSLNNGDPNSNNIIEKCPNKAPIKTPKTRLTELTTTKNNNQQIVKKRETSPEIRRPSSAKGIGSGKETIINRPKSSGSRIATFNNGIKQPTKVTAQVSGLPKLQTPRIANEELEDNKKKLGKLNLEKAPLARFDDVEAMHVSSDTLPDEEIFDSGLGNSESDRKEGDNETLAEVSELASDINAGFLGTNSMKQNETVMRIRPNKIDVKVVEKGEMKAVDLMKKITSRFNQEDDFADYKEEKTSTNEVMKIVNIESRRISEDSSDRKRSTSMQNSTGSIGSPIEMDALSPPSERDTFLIDDEICDQPQLIQCQSPDLSSFLRSQDFFGHRDQDPFAEDGGKEGMAVFRSGSLDTLSSSSSIGSNDLMLDFDQGDDNTLVENLSRRLSCEECEQNASENMKPKEHCRHRSKSLRSQHESASLQLIDEWNNLVETHSKDGTTGRSRSRRLRSATSPETPNSTDARVLRPPRQMSEGEVDDGGVVIDPSSFRLLSQDVTNVKTMLLKLKRVLQEADTLNPFECHTLWKNGLFHSLAHSDPPRGVDNHEEITQENTDLRRQVVFLQQQLDEKDRTIHLLQQQMTKYTTSKPVATPAADTTNAATQTDKPRLSLTSMSQTLEESSFGTTVSSKNKSRPKLPHKPKYLTRQTNVTRSLNSIPTSVQPANNSTDQRPLCQRLGSVERSASAGDLSKTTKADKNVDDMNSQVNAIIKTMPKSESSGAVKKENGNSRPRSRIAAPVFESKGLRYSLRGRKTINN